ncbi:MAG: GAF domain-containing sensor histidine kinase [Labedaea sp.]
MFLTGNRQVSARLLDAVISISRDLRLRDVLQRIVGYACDLVDARYGALGVAGPNGSLVDVVYQGLDQRAMAAIGNPPRGTGLLGALIRHPMPIRLNDLTEHPTAVGFPPNHPQMRTFLGVPLLIGDEVFGTLYVTEKGGGGEFTEEDQDILLALAEAAGVAVDNARMFERTRQREIWVQASNEITSALLAETTPTDELQLITERVRSVAGAPIAAIALPHEAERGKLVFKVVDGLGWANNGLVGSTIDIATTASGVVFSTGSPLLLDSYGDAAATWQDTHNGGAPPVLRELGSAAIVPLAAGEQILGVLLLVKMRGEAPFGEPDLELLQNFAAHAALALRYAKARSDQRKLAVFEDRDRIAGDMQNVVIRRLFDIGLGLEGVSRLVPPALRNRISGLVDDLDGTIRDLRHSIFSLQAGLDPDQELPGTLNEAVLRIIGEAADALGFEPRVGLAGSLDSVVPQRFQPDLLATLREALANVARHAQASSVSVQLRVADGELTMDVLDDGIGIPLDRERNSGLANLTRRAERWGGNLAVAPGGGGGTRLTWTVPLMEA